VCFQPTPQKLEFLKIFMKPDTVCDIFVCFQPTPQKLEFLKIFMNTAWLGLKRN